MFALSFDASAVGSRLDTTWNHKNQQLALFFTLFQQIISGLCNFVNFFWLTYAHAHHLSDSVRFGPTTVPGDTIQF